MIQIIKFSYNDDCVGLTDVSVMIAPSKDCAKEIILDEINKGFESNWKNLREASTELNNNIGGSFFSENENVFKWRDNGKGVTYLIGSIILSQMEMNRKFQNIGVI